MAQCYEWMGKLSLALLHICTTFFWSPGIWSVGRENAKNPNIQFYLGYEWVCVRLCGGAEGREFKFVASIGEQNVEMKMKNVCFDCI